LDFPARGQPGFATIKVRNTATIPQTLRDLGVDPAVILRAAGLEPDLFLNPENVYSYAALGRLAAESVRATGREDFGLRVGSKLGVQAVGLAGLVSLHAPTVGEALRVVIEGLRTTDTGGAVYLETNAERVACGYIVKAPDVEAAEQIIDGAVAVLFNTMRSLCGPDWRPLAVRLTRSPPRERAAFAKFFEAPVEYSALAAALIFPAATLDAPRARPQAGIRTDSRSPARRSAGEGERRFCNLGQVRHSQPDRRGSPHTRPRDPSARTQYPHLRTPAGDTRTDIFRPRGRGQI
jgi:hypothetical protein